MSSDSEVAHALGLAERKLAESGLTLEDARQLRMTVLTESEVTALHPAFKPHPALRIAYHGPDGSPISDWPKARPYYRLRYLYPPADASSSGFTAQTKKQRYANEPDTAPVAYYPQTYPSWQNLVENSSDALLVVEGELKAAAAVKAGFPAVGIGGVYNWRSHPKGITFLDSLQLIKWVKRNVYLCFDSDYKTNPMVCSALGELAEELHRQGAFVHVVSLPAIDTGKKTGLDDFLVSEGPEKGPERLREMLHNAEPLGLTRVLFRMNDKYVYIRDPGLILNRETSAKIQPGAFVQHVESAAMYEERAIRKDGTVSYEPVPASGAWLKWPLRQEAGRLTYAPGEPRLVPGASGTEYNLWAGWAVKPEPGDVIRFLKLVGHLFADLEPEALTWLYRWLAYPLQHPGTKMFSAVVVHGIHQGSGKSSIGYTMKEIYGENWVEIKQADLTADFNPWAAEKQFVMADDITGTNKREDADKLKKLITQLTNTVNKKFLPQYTVPDCINYLFTGNQPDSLFLEDTDRRYLIVEVNSTPLPAEWYREYYDWLRNKGGAAALFDYFLKLDLGDFNPAGPAYKTMAKERMIVRGQSDLAGWVRELLTFPDQVLKVGNVELTEDLFSSRFLLELYDAGRHTGTTANGMSRELDRAGAKQVCNGQPIRTPDGQFRYYAIRNREKWAKAVATDVTSHLAQHRRK